MVEEEKCGDQCKTFSLHTVRRSFLRARTQKKKKEAWPDTVHIFFLSPHFSFFSTPFFFWAKQQSPSSLCLSHACHSTKTTQKTSLVPSLDRIWTCSNSSAALAINQLHTSKRKTNLKPVKHPQKTHFCSRISCCN